jgi:hypothetical protein
MGEGTSASFKIHFGGYDKNAWAPIYVGLTVGTPSTAERDAWLERMNEVSKRLPLNTVVGDGGPKTALALAPFHWESSEELDDAFVGRLVETTLQFAKVFGPLLAAKRS